MPPSEQPHSAAAHTAANITASTAFNSAAPSMLDITVAIPTYNGARKLPKVLDKLRSQINTSQLRWEVIVCDNRSTDDTAEVVRTYQTHWPASPPLRYCFAGQAGAAFARQRAVEAANGELIAFLDDDNLPTADWLFQAYTFAQQHPEAGGIGSQIHGLFEGLETSQTEGPAANKLPQALEGIKTFLAIIERGDRPQRYEPASKMLPPAAGLVVRRQAWLSHVPSPLFLNNTSKSAGLASEDLEALLHIQQAGWAVWYNPAMVVYHDIPKERLEEDYLLSLLRCVGLSCFYLRMMRAQPWEKPLRVPAYMANDLFKFISHRYRFGPQHKLSTVEKCRRSQLAHAVKSPFFLLKKSYADRTQARRDKQHPEQPQWLEKINRAFEQDAFVLYQQPVVSLNSEATTTNRRPNIQQKELLLRLQAPQQQTQQSDILPRHFLPTAQRYGLMRTIDRWVIKQLIQQLREAAYLDPSSNFYAVNLSQSSVQDPTLPDFIFQKLQAANLVPALLCFEISAETATAHPIATKHLIQALHRIGCQATLDNVMLSRTTVNMAAQLPFNYLKLASEMVPMLQQGQGAWTAITELMQNKTWEAIATGIESQTVLNAIQQQGIRYAQGYQTGRPSPLFSSARSPTLSLL